MLKMSMRDTDCDELRQCARGGGDFFERDQHGWNALHWATSEAQVENVRELLSLEKAVRHDAEEEGGLLADEISGMDFVNARDDVNGWTPLHLAAIGGSSKHFEAASHLLDNGARRDIRDAYGDTPQDCVAAKGGKAKAAWRMLLS